MIYALLVGINRYISKNISNLGGCEFDTDQVELALEKLGNSRNIRPSIKKLIDQEAKRSSIIHQFRTHFAPAEKDDIVFFYFSGHGSRERSPEGFWKYQGDKFHESIVCFDSDTDFDGQIYDIADKEIQYLIKPYADRGCEVILIMDCCHSGSGSRAEKRRDFGIREAKRDEDYLAERPVNSFLPELFEGDTYLHLDRAPRHLLFAACHPKEYSRERAIDFHIQGVFTHSLMEVLNEPGGFDYSYEHLQQACRNKVFELLPDVQQHPRIEPYGGMNVKKGFLKTDQISQQLLYKALTFNFKDKRWQINMGGIHGLEIGKRAHFQIYETEEEAISGEGAIGYVETANVRLNRSDCEVFLYDEYNGLLLSEPYVVVPSHLPLTKLKVGIEGENLFHHLIPAKDIKLVQSKNGNEKFKKVNIVSKEEFEHTIELIPEEKFWKKARYKLIVSNDTLRIVYQESGRNLVRPIPRMNDEGISNVVVVAQLLCYIANWERVHTLNNPDTTLSKELDEIDLGFRKKSNKDYTFDSPFTLDFFPEKDSAGIETEFVVRNRSSANLQCAPLYLSPDFEIYDELGFVDLEPSDLPRQLDSIPFLIPKELIPFLNQVTDRYQVIFSEEKLPYLAIGQSESLQELADKLMEPFRSDKPIEEEDRKRRSRYRGKKDYSKAWFTKSFTIKLLKELGKIGHGPIQISQEKAPSISIASHPDFEASISLTSSGEHHGGLESDRDIYEVMTNLGFEVLDFSPYPTQETVLEIHHIEKEGTLKNQPLKIELETELPSDIDLIALTLPPSLDPAEVGSFPGTYPILAYMKNHGDGNFFFELDRILQNPPDGRPNPHMSLKISFVLINSAHKGQWKNWTVIDENGQIWLDCGKLLVE